MMTRAITHIVNKLRKINEIVIIYYLRIIICHIIIISLNRSENTFGKI